MLLVCECGHQNIYACVQVPAFIICTCRFPWTGMCAGGQHRDRMKDCHMCGNAATDHFYHIILRAQVCKCVTCLCISGCAPVLVKRIMKWSQMGEKKNKTASWEKKKRKEMLWMSGKVTGECTISYNSDLNPTKKKERETEREREKLHSNGHETIDFIEKVCWKSKHNFSGSWQLWGLIIVFRPPAEFILLSS